MPRAWSITYVKVVMTKYAHTISRRYGGHIQYRNGGNRLKPAGLPHPICDNLTTLWIAATPQRVQIE